MRTLTMIRCGVRRKLLRAALPLRSKEILERVSLNFARRGEGLRVQLQRIHLTRLHAMASSTADTEIVMMTADGPRAHMRMKNSENDISLGLRATESSIEKSRNQQKECPCIRSSEQEKSR